MTEARSFAELRPLRLIGFFPQAARMIKGFRAIRILRLLRLLKLQRHLNASGQKYSA